MFFSFQGCVLPQRHRVQHQSDQEESVPEPGLRHRRRNGPALRGFLHGHGQGAYQRGGPGHREDSNLRGKFSVCHDHDVWVKNRGLAQWTLVHPGKQTTCTYRSCCYRPFFNGSHCTHRTSNLESAIRVRDITLILLRVTGSNFYCMTKIFLCWQPGRADLSPPGPL